MKIGINATSRTAKSSIDSLAKYAQEAKDDGFSSFWMPEHPFGGTDVMVQATAVGLRVPDIELGTAVIAIYPRHPMVMVGQMNSIEDAIGDRFTLGIGMSHKLLMDVMGIPFDRPIRHLKEYLSILIPALNEGKVDFKGEMLSCVVKSMFYERKSRASVIVAALGPQALKVTGRLADGTTLAWAGPKTVRNHVKPILSEAASEAGRPAPRIIGTLPICVTDNEAGFRESVNENTAFYRKLPSYQAMFEREGASGPGDLALVGSAAKVTELLEELSDAGITDFAASEAFTTNDTERAATREVLKAYNKRNA